jgi:hypothetical protein
MLFRNQDSDFARKIRFVETGKQETFLLKIKSFAGKYNISSL